MAWVNLYGQVSDNNGYVRSTSSMRGQVNQVSFWLNSIFGDVMRVGSKLVDGSKIVSKPDLRKVKKEDREEVMKRYQEEVNRENKVVIDIDIEPKKEFVFRINDIELSYDRLKLMRDMQLKRMDMQIEALKNLKEKDKNVLQVAKVVLNG